MLMMLPLTHSALAAAIVSKPPPRFPTPPALDSVPSDLSHVAVTPETLATCTRCTVKPVPPVIFMMLPTEADENGKAALVHFVLVVPSITKSVNATCAASCMA